jgi:hypothetical protein
MVPTKLSETNRASLFRPQAPHIAGVARRRGPLTGEERGDEVGDEWASLGGRETCEGGMLLRYSLGL